MKIRPSSKKIAAMTMASLGLAVASQSRAAIIAYDGFESYTTGAALVGQGSGGTGWPTDWAGLTNPQVSSASLTYSSGTVSHNGGSKAMGVTNTNNNSLLSRSFAAQTGTVYFSFLVRVPTNADWTGNEFFQFFVSDDTDNSNSGAIGDMNTGGSGFQARVTSNGTTNTTGSNSVYNLNQTYLLVGKFSKSGVNASNYDTMDLFVNPTSLTEPVTPTSTTGSNSLISSVTHFGLRTLNITDGDSFLFDEVRVGSSFASVVVPEPGSCVLLGLGTLSLLLRRRRQA